MKTHFNFWSLPRILLKLEWVTDPVDWIPEIEKLESKHSVMYFLTGLDIRIMIPFLFCDGRNITGPFQYGPAQPPLAPRREAFQAAENGIYPSRENAAINSNNKNRVAAPLACAGTVQPTATPHTHLSVDV